MKSCPACKRTFEDTTVFCLVDGSILSAPFDPNAPARPSEPPPTAVMKTPRDTHSAQSTVTKPTPMAPQQPSPTTPTPSRDTTPNSTKKFLFVGAGLALFGLFVSAALLLIFLGSSQNCPTIRVSCYPSTESASCSISVDEAVKNNYAPDTNSLICSLSPVLAFQAAGLPKSVTDVSWTASAGKLRQDPAYEAMADVDTTGLAGREITVTAKVSGYGWRCANSASTTFVAK